MKKKADTSEAVLDEHEIPSQKGNSKKSSSIYLDKAISSEEKLKIDKMFEAKEHAMLPTKSVKKIKTELKNKEQKQNTVCDETSKSTYHAVQYLTLWKNNRSKWKFKKTRQVWLLQNMYCKEKINKENFKILLEYLSDLKGQSRDWTIKEAQRLLEEDTSKTTIKRATKVLRLLS